VGMDNISGSPRFTLSYSAFFKSIEFVPLLMGVFGVAEVIRAFLHPPTGSASLISFRVRDLYPNREELRRSVKPILRGSVLGFLVGLIPGPAAVIASFSSYGLERRMSHPPEGFGNGAVEGVAGPEAANNSACGGGMVPLLALGLPFSPPTAVLISGLILHNVQPGPLLMQQKPDLFWGIVGSMYTGNVMLVFLNLPLISIWVKLLRVPYVLLFPVILMLCLVGAYSINNGILDIFIMVFFGVGGYLMKKFDYPAAPVVLALILGPMLEKNLGQSLMMSNGSFMIFVTRSIPLGMLGVTAFLLVSPFLLKLWKRRRPGLLLEGQGD